MRPPLFEPSQPRNPRDVQGTETELKSGCIPGRQPGPSVARAVQNTQACLLGLLMIFPSLVVSADEIARPIGGVLADTTLSGQVVASTAWNPGSELVPIPEPATGVLAGVGGALLFLGGRRRRST